jgi:hypothetical protein
MASFRRSSFLFSHSPNLILWKLKTNSENENIEFLLLVYFRSGVMVISGFTEFDNNVVHLFVYLFIYLFYIFICFL